MKSQTIIIILAIVCVILFSLFILYKVSYDKAKKHETNWGTSAVYLAGFDYDEDQGLYVTRRDALQRIGGYNDFYDKLATPLYMPIDSEPIEFVYEGRPWRVWLWKGQYYAATGCEVGLYRGFKNNERPGMFECSYDEDMIEMSYDCYADGKKLFSRHDTHWWLTGFKPGHFTNPVNVSMENISLTFNSVGMAKAFYDAMDIYFKKNKKEYKYTISDATVKFRWKTPISPQTSDIERKDPLAWCKYMAKQSYDIMDGNFDPTYISNYITNVQKFIERDGHFYDMLAFMTNKKGSEDKLRTEAGEWESANKNLNLSTVIDTMDYLKKRADVWTTPLIALLKPYCMMHKNSPLCAVLKMAGQLN